ncbi:ankyrin repeat-containing domain protein [Aspergillus germanicus]
MQSDFLRNSHDQFFIQLLAKLSEADPGFGGMTPLHEAVVKDCISSLASLVSSTQPQCNGANFLGQTPLHLAGSNVEIARVLVQSGHDIDAVDGLGRTPLMYAAALGYTDTVQFLIYRKANIFMTDHDLHLNFISHASYRGNWDLIMGALKAIRQSRCLETYQRLIHCAIWELLEFYSSRIDPERCSNATRGFYFVKLVNCCDDVNRTHEGTGDTMLHRVSHRDEADALVRQGFTKFDHRNRRGHLPIHSARYSEGGAQLVEFFLNHDTYINSNDRDGKAIMVYLFQTFMKVIAKSRELNAIDACLTHGLNILALNSSRCA